MKLRLPLLLFLFVPGHWRIPLNVSAPTLSATTKKPASQAGFRYLRLANSHLIALFPLASPLSRSPGSLQLTIQTPSSF